MNVLLVSYNLAVSRQVESALRDDEDTEIFTVRTPQRAVQQIDDVGGFDIVVADNDTTPTGGFFLARELTHRKQAGTPTPPLVLLIARDDDKYLAKWSGADAFIRKPVDPFDLAEVCEALVAGEPVPALPAVGTTADVSDKGFGVPEGQEFGAPLATGGP